MTVYVQDADFTLHHGDVLDVLPTLPDGSVNCCVTSPPFYGLRDYGVDGQLGLEPTPDEYVARMVSVFREVRRVLRDDGSLWLNLGDGYASSPPGNVRGVGETSGLHGAATSSRYRETLIAGHATKRSTIVGDLKPKNLVGIPWRVAFALQADGWYLRSDIIWSKPNPMPESVTDRPTKAHEYVFLLTKSPRYWFDQEAVREPAEWNRWGDQTVGAGSNPNGWIKPKTREELNANRSSYRPGQTTGNTLEGHQRKSDAGLPVNPAGRNVRSVWEIPTQPYAEAHFATYPQELVRRCLLAGCPEWVCGTCGKPRERIVERGESDYARLKREQGHEWTDMDAAGLDRGVITRAGEGGQTRNSNGTVPSLRSADTETVGWSDCGHDNYQPGTVLDPFLGSGTTALVARNHGRRSIGIELNADYCALAARRLQQQSLLAGDAA